MALVAFKNTHNQDVYVNPAQVLYISTFEEGVTIIAMAITSAGGQPYALYVRGSVELTRQRLEGGPVRTHPRPQVVAHNVEQSAEA
ncbi:hypothetical protein [Ciceribacter sp. L1K22]|uniref:hypothetical protein n=1 Tax=Ciceribacter sp. L1K22 TaxID=2820275 RepID=UPI001ABE0C24|nr:hypothetical protein [Ciceribacter sp. L1K22]MBO3760473.1 hypothetical protein [Ciceribacter sp. L1K22]